MIMPFLYRYPFLSVCTRGLASSFWDKNLFFVWTSTQYLSGGNVTCQTVTCYSEFVSALSVGLASLCPSPSGLNYFVMAALKCRNSLQFSGFHLSSCWRRRCPTRFRRFSERGSASSSLGAVRLTVYRVWRNCQKRDQLPWGVFHDYSGWGPLAIGLAPRSSRSTVRWFHQHVFEALRGSPFAEGFFPPFPLLGWGGRGEAGAKRLLKKWFPVFRLQSAGGGGTRLGGFVVCLQGRSQDL